MDEIKRNPGTVFVSSTCADLIDLRAVLEQTLRGAGLRAVMSERTGSEFVNPGDRSAIDTCLVNLRSSESCVVILSQRYGAPMPDRGGISATHLEYRHAASTGTPIRVYVRDRLMADFEAFRSNPGFVPTWADQDHAKDLFGLLAEHMDPRKEGGAGWIWTFRTATDLCDRVLTDLGGLASTAIIRMLTERGRLPHLELELSGAGQPQRPTVLTNAGAVAASRVRVLTSRRELAYDFACVQPGERKSFQIFFDQVDFTKAGGGHVPAVQVCYDTPTGERMSDLFAVLPAGEGRVRAVAAGRRYLGNALRAQSPDLEIRGGVTAIPNGPFNQAHVQGDL